MPIELVLRYSELYPYAEDDLDAIIQEIPSKAALINLAVALDLIERGYGQYEILKIFLRRLNSSDFKDVVDRIKDFSLRYRNQVNIFSRLHISDLMMYIIKNRNDSSVDTSPLQDLKLFQAYLILIEQISDHYETLIDKVRDNKNNPFAELTWPLVARQHQFNGRPYELFQAIRSIVLLDELEKIGMGKYLKAYSNVVGMDGKKYVSILSELVALKEVNSNATPLPILRITGSEREFIKHLILNLDSLNISDRATTDFLLLKKQPLLHFNDDIYIVLNRLFLKNKIYNGFIFDFFHASGIKEHFGDFGTFKSFIGSEVAEKRLFIPLLKAIYNKKHHLIKFEGKLLNCDAYLRIHNRIFLFEFKDYMMPSRVTASDSYEAVKNEIDLKFIKNERGKKKGIKQLLEQIKNLNNPDFVKANDEGLNYLRKEKIEVFPIVVYADRLYSMPGINSYLITVFQDECTNSMYKKIYPPTLISMQFFFRHVQHLSSSRLDKLIGNYYKFLSEKEKKGTKTFNPNYWIDSHLSFEDSVPEKLMQHNSNKKSTEIFLKELNIVRPTT